MSIARGHGGRLDVIDRVFFPHSLGLLYLAITQYLGFKKYGDEYKVMGLAPYGKPAHTDADRNSWSSSRPAAASRSTSTTSAIGPARSR